MTFDGVEKARVARFAQAGDYLENNWEVNKNGESYLIHSTAGRPDLLREALDILKVLIPRVEAAEREIAEEYGWTRDESLNTAYRKFKGGEREIQERPAEGTLPEGVAELIDRAGRGRVYHKGLVETYDAHKLGAAVEVKDEAFYLDPSTRLYLADDGSAGAALTTDDDLVSVFKVPGCSGWSMGRSCG